MTLLKRINNASKANNLVLKTLAGKLIRAHILKVDLLLRDCRDFIKKNEEEKIIKHTNPVTGTPYKLKVKTVKAGKRGSILGKWKPLHGDHGEPYENN